MIRAALRGLTTRGRSFLAAALAAAFSALLLGERELLQVAALLFALPLLAAVTVARTRYRLSCTRSVTPARIQAGTTAQVTLRLENLSRLPTGVLLLEERLPPALGEPPRFVLDRLASRRSSAVRYPIQVEVRGRHEIGPLTVRLTDPFGLCELTRSFTRTERILATPPVTPLPPVRLTGTRPGAGTISTHTASMRGDDDATTREYRHGDDFRRVHWRSTARVGELMVRREEQPWQATATLLLDTRGAAHHGDDLISSLEWSVGAAASIAVHLLRAGFTLRLVTDGGIDQTIPAHDGEDLALGLLAEVTPGPQPGLDAALERVRPDRDGLLVAVVGLLEPADCARLAALRANGATAVAVLVDATAWTSLPTSQRAAADTRYQTTTQRLATAGWRVLPARPGARINTLWPQAGGRGTTPPVVTPPVITVNGLDPRSASNGQEPHLDPGSANGQGPHRGQASTNGWRPVNGAGTGDVPWTGAAPNGGPVTPVSPVTGLGATTGPTAPERSMRR